jgi:DNA-directed RNA polymerase specialized sigma24 family protein
MGRHDQTDMGGTGESFLTTHWSLVEHIRSDEDKDRALIGVLLERYWKPVYCYLRHKGCDNEEAKDLTQGFFHEVVLNRDLVQRADPAKGRFRTFLLHALDQYLINERRRQGRQKRTPRGQLVALDIGEPLVLPEVVARLNAEDSYHYAWTAALLDHVLGEVEAECVADGLETHWKVFQDRVVQPILSDSRPPVFSEVCRRYDIADSRKASNMIMTVKRRLQKALVRYLRTTTTGEDEVEEELAEIVKYFSEGAQDSGEVVDI